MDRRFFSFLLLSVLFLFGYSYFIAKYYPQQKSLFQAETKTEATTVAREETEPLPVPEKELLDQSETENFIVTYSLTGGYIKKLYSKVYQEDLSFESIGFTEADKSTLFTLSTEADKAVLTAADKNLRKEFDFNGYTISLRINGDCDGRKTTIFSNSLNKNGLDQRYQEFFYKDSSAQAQFSRLNFKKVKSSTFDVSVIGARDRYFCCAVYGDIYKAEVIRPSNDTIAIELDLSPAQTITIYAGPQLKKELAPLGLEEVIYYGFFNAIAIILKKLLYFLLFLTKSWGISIMLLSLIIYGFLFPFTARSTKSMRQMQLLQPKIEELKEKHKDNPQKMNKEVIELYKKYKVNPIGGCLPVFFQFPVFIALYQMLLRFVEMKGASFLWIKDLSLPDRAFHLPFTLPFLGEYVNIIPLILMVLGLFQHKFMSPSPAEGQQKQMGLFMAVFIGIIFYNFPSCLVLYWFVQNLLTFLYQFRISQTTAQAA